MNMNPNYISGLVQADGSFFVNLEKRGAKQSKFGVRLRPKFSLTLHINSIQTLQLVNAYLPLIAVTFTFLKIRRKMLRNWLYLLYKICEAKTTRKSSLSNLSIIRK